MNAIHKLEPKIVSQDGLNQQSSPTPIPREQGDQTLLPKIVQALRKRRRLGDLGFIWFLRLLALFCMILGVTWGVRIIGVYEGMLWRFDLMPTPWKLATLVMTLLYLFASVGLWLLAPWGIVVWFVAAISEVMLYGPYQEIFGFRPVVIFTNLLIGILFIAFRIWQEIQRRADRDQAIR